MAGAGLLDLGCRRGVAAALAIHHLDDVKAGRTSQDGRCLARLEAGDGFGKHARQALGAAPAEIAAGQGVRRVGIAGSELVEGFAAGHPGGHVLGLGAQAGKLLGARALGGAEQDVGEVVLFLPDHVFGIGEEVIHLGVGNDDPAFHFALTHAGQEDLVADFLAEAIPGDSVPLEGLAEVGHRQLVVVGDAPESPVEGDVIDPQRGFVGELDLKAFHDLALEHLAFEHVGRRQWRALARELARDLPDPQAQIGTGDDLAVHDRHDPIHFHRSVGGRG